MLKFSRKAIPGIFVILALLLGGWSSPISRVAQSPASGSGDNESHPQIPDKIDASKVVKSGDLRLKGYLGKLPGVQERVNTLSSFSPDSGAITSASLTDLDKEFISESVESNTLELWSIEFALSKGVKDPNLKDFLLMMQEMHTRDLKASIDLAKSLGLDTTVDFTKMSVYPETPSYDLGVRIQNAKMDYLDHLIEPAKVSFDEIVLDILDKEHVDDVQGELTAEREVSIPAMKAFTKHAADVTQLHLQLMDVLSAKISSGYDEAPEPDYQSGYMNPYEITVSGGNGSNGQPTPTVEPTMMPTTEPTLVPTSESTSLPTTAPTLMPTSESTSLPTTEPTLMPTSASTSLPTSAPISVP